MRTYNIIRMAEEVGRTDMILELMNISQHVFALFRGLNPRFNEGYDEKNDFKILGSLVESDQKISQLLDDPQFLRGYKTAIATALDFCETFVHNFEYKKRIEREGVEKKIEEFKIRVLKVYKWQEIDGMFEEFRDTVNRPLTIWFNEYVEEMIKT